MKNPPLSQQREIHTKRNSHNMTRNGSNVTRKDHTMTITQKRGYTNLTIEEYTKLGTLQRQEVPETVKQRLTQQLKYQIESYQPPKIYGDPQTNQAFKTLTQPLKTTKTWDPPKPKPCPNTRKILLKHQHGHDIVKTVHCKKRSCPACSQEWLNEHVACTDDLINENPTAFMLYTIQPDQKQAWKQYVRKMRRRGHIVNGIRIPVDIYGASAAIVTYHPHQTAEFNPTLIDNPKQAIHELLETCLEACKAADDIPQPHTPKIGRCTGIGAWKNKIRLHTHKPENQHKYVAELDPNLDIDQIRDAARASGGHLGPEKPDSLEVAFKTPTQRAQWLAHIGITADDPFP